MVEENENYQDFKPLQYSLKQHEQNLFIIKKKCLQKAKTQEAVMLFF
jgi:hypothetical protein